MSKTSQLDFELFKSSALHWQKLLGITDWVIYFDHDNNTERYAGCAWSIPGGVATLSLSKTWDDVRPKNKKEIERCALHEMLHLLFARWIHEAESRYTALEVMEGMEHSVLRRIENVMMEYHHAEV